MKKSLKTLSRAFLLTVCISLILVFSAGGCRLEIPSEEENSGSEEAWDISEQPDKELFDQYFSDIELRGSRFGPITHSSAFKSNEEGNICILLPHQGATLSIGFKNKDNFLFKIEVLDLGSNTFVERCAMVAYSEGSDGAFMEALEWVFLHPGNYEYRIYIENKLAAALPFEVVSYFDYIFRNRGE